MVKTILYTSNPNFVPNSLVEVADFAMENDKYYTYLVNEDNELYNVVPGAHIVTTKGNHVYVLDVYDDNCINEGKKQNITGVVSVDYPFGEAPVDNIAIAFEADIMPQEVSNVKMTIKGSLVVRVGNKWVSITDDNKLEAYPEAFTVDIPVYTVSKSKDQLKAGDIIVVGSTYAKITAIENDEIKAISYKGCNKTVRTIKDVVFGQDLVRVVMTPTGDMNPMMLMLLGKKSGRSNMNSLLPLMMMNKDNKIDPMMLMLMNGNKSSVNDLLMLQMMSGKNLFGNN